MRLPGSEDSDGESGEHWQREWWRARNERVITRWRLAMSEVLMFGCCISYLDLLSLSDIKHLGLRSLFCLDVTVSEGTQG